MATGTRTEWPQTVVVGRIVKPHGLRGEVVVEVMSDVPERFSVGSDLLMIPESGGASSTIRIGGRRRHGAQLLVVVEGVEDREGAEALRGAWLEVGRDRVPAAPTGSYYYYQLLGCTCRDRRDGDLGSVVDVVEDGGGLLLVVRDGHRELLVPFVEAMVVRIDPDEGIIELDLPAGLLETCASTS